MHSSRDPVNYPLNDRYESDVHYVFQMCNYILRLLGIYPFIYSNGNVLEQLVSTLLILSYCSLLQFITVPYGYYIIYCGDEITVKIKCAAPFLFCVSSFCKYGYLGVKIPALARCIEHVRNDWRTLQDEEHRSIMLEHVAMSRNLIKLSVMFLYTGALSYYTVIPLLTRGRNKDNYTIRSLNYIGYEVYFDMQKDVTYKIIFFIQFIYVLVACSIPVLGYGLTAVFTTHACGQIKIQNLRLESLIRDGMRLKSGFNDRLRFAVKRHVEILKFAREVENALHGLYFIEVLVSTLLMCLLEYCCMMEWKDKDTVVTSTYVVLLISFSFNIFIPCYAGELLITQANEIMHATYESRWYNLLGKEARDIVLLLAVSRNPPKLTAGKVIVLSLNTFGEVVKASFVYLNMLRTMSDF